MAVCAFENPFRSISDGSSKITFVSEKSAINFAKSFRQISDFLSETLYASPFSPFKSRKIREEAASAE